MFPPSTHRRNRAERAIQDWKGHFISCLDNVDLDFRMSLWCELIPQVELTLNHLRPYAPQPSTSAYEGLYGKKYDFLAHPIHPPGTKVIILDPVSTRETWAPTALMGFTLVQHSNIIAAFLFYFFVNLKNSNDINKKKSLAFILDFFFCLFYILYVENFMKKAQCFKLSPIQIFINCF